MLVGLGVPPFKAAVLCLIANTAPVAFGAMGIPVIVAGQVSGIDPFLIGQMAGRQLPFMTILVLFWIMAIMDGWRGVKATWPAVLVGGGFLGGGRSAAQQGDGVFLGLVAGYAFVQGPDPVVQGGPRWVGVEVIVERAACGFAVEICFVVFR